MDRLTPLPAAASWRHHGTRTGFEVTFFSAMPDGHRLTGRTTADDGATMWSVDYGVIVDHAWRTHEAHASASTVSGTHHVVLARDGGRMEGER